jgi:HAD superfamily hydrolase (TIGR01509 family)
MGGMPTAQIIRALAADAGVEVHDVDAMVHEKERLFLQMLDAVAPIAPVVAIASAYRGTLPMAVASGGYRDVVGRTLDRLQLRPWFQAMVTAEDTARHKPEPDVFLEAARRLDVPPSACAVFEDTELGLEAARRAPACSGLDVRPWGKTPDRGTRLLPRPRDSEAGFDPDAVAEAVDTRAAHRVQRLQREPQADQPRVGRQVDELGPLRPDALEPREEPQRDRVEVQAAAAPEVGSSRRPWRASSGRWSRSCPASRSRPPRSTSGRSTGSALHREARPHGRAARRALRLRPRPLGDHPAPRPRAHRRRRRGPCDPASR